MCAALCLCVLCGIAVAGASAASESFGFSLKLGSAANCRSYGGKNINTFNPQNADKDRGSYEGGTVEVTNNVTSSTIHLKERQNFKNAYYLLLPFTMTVEVPANTCYKVTLSYDIKLQRNAKGESWYVMEWTDNTDGAAYKRTYSANNADASGGICRLHSSAKSACTGSGTVELTFDNLNSSAQKSMTREYAIFVGNSQSNSLLTSYHHQLETTFTLSKKSCTTTKTVRLNANGGKVSPASKVVTCGKTYGTLPTPTRTGYDFDGWYTRQSSGIKVDKNTSVGTNPPTTLYAHWKGKTYTVSLDANGGTVGMKSRTATYGSEYPALPAPTRTGYSFDGWYTQKTGGTKVDDNTTVTTAANHTLYAHWHLTPAIAPYDVKLEMDATGVYGEHIYRHVSYSSTDDHTKETTWYACDENGNNGTLLTDENGKPTSPKTPTAGVHYYYVLVTATRKDNGLQASTKSNVVCVTVTKATPKITEPPTAAALDLAKGNTLAASTLTGGVAKNYNIRSGSNVVAGRFVWKNAAVTVKPPLGWKYYDVVFQPNDTDNYETTETTVKVKVICKHEGAWSAGKRTCTACGEVETRTNTVTVTWGELAYTYTDGAWNPATHDYDIGGGWAPNRKNGDVITVQNEGANEVRVKFQYTRTDTAIGGSFADSDGNTVSSISLPISGTKTVRLCPTGRPGKALNNAKIGSVTVRLEGGY